MVFWDTQDNNLKTNVSTERDITNKNILTNEKSQSNRIINEIYNCSKLKKKVNKPKNIYQI